MVGIMIYDQQRNVLLLRLLSKWQIMASGVV